MRAVPSPSCLHRVTACGQLAAAVAGMKTDSAGEEEGAALVQSHKRLKRAETCSQVCCGKFGTSSGAATGVRAVVGSRPPLRRGVHMAGNRYFNKLQ